MSQTKTLTMMCGLALASAGCEPPKPVAKAAPTATSGAATEEPVVAVSGAMAEAFGAASGTPAAPAQPAPSITGGVTTLTLAASHGILAERVERMMKVLATVQDEASAQAAAPQMRLLAVEIPAAMKQFKATVATLSLSGQDREVDEFFTQQVEKRVSDTDNLMTRLEALVNSPQGPLLRNEVNSLLDGMLEAATSGDRRGLQKLIEQKQLRR